MYNYNTRLQNKGNYYLPRAKTSYGQITLEFRNTKFWTNLDPALKNATWYTFKNTEKSAYSNLQSLTKTMRNFWGKSVLVTIAMIDLLFNLMCLSITSLEKHFKNIAQAVVFRKHQTCLPQRFIQYFLALIFFTCVL